MGREPMEPEIESPRGRWPLADTVKPYARHALVCTGTTVWPARLEDAPGLLGRMARDVRDLRGVEEAPPKLTATDAASKGPDPDVLVFPDGVRYEGVDEARWREILDRHLVRGEPAEAVPRESLGGRHVFVCVHAERDPRCGRCGPPLVAALREAAAAAGLADVRVLATSHVGGHKYAGNVIVYPEGVWYGYVEPDDAPRLVGEHLVGGRVVTELLRGTAVGT